MKSSFEIYKLSGFTNGMLALCPQPQNHSDFAKISMWNPGVVVTLTQKHEFPDITPSLVDRFENSNFKWIHQPIVDFDVPAPNQQSNWQDIFSKLGQILDNNGKVLIHCKGGNGRSGMLVLRLLLLQGEDSTNALNRLRTVRKGAVETSEQLDWAINGFPIDKQPLNIG